MDRRAGVFADATLRIGDLNEARIDTQIQTIKYLEQYMSPT